MEKERLRSFEQMKVWQEAHSLVMRVFEITPRLPEEHQEVLALQMEKTAIEVPKSIAEGFKRRGPRNKAHYYNVAQSFLESLRYYFILCRDLKHDVDYDDIAARIDAVSRMLDGLVRSMSGGNDDRGGGRRGGRGRGRRHGQGGGPDMPMEGGPADTNDSFDMDEPQGPGPESEDFRSENQ